MFGCNTREFKYSSCKEGILLRLPITDNNLQSIIKTGIINFDGPEKGKDYNHRFAKYNFMQINRFNQDGTKDKTKIDIPLKINIDNQTLELLGIILHKGDSTNSGHYIAIVKRNNIWYNCDDANITEINIENALNTNNVKENAYILLYELVGTPLLGGSKHYKLITK